MVVHKFLVPLAVAVLTGHQAVLDHINGQGHIGSKDGGEVGRSVSSHGERQLACVGIEFAVDVHIGQDWRWVGIDSLLAEHLGHQLGIVDVIPQSGG